MLAERGGADFLFLDDQHVERVADGLVELSRDEADPGWEEADATDTDVDVDVGSVLSDEAVVEESADGSRGTLGEAESLSDSLNELLLK